jgi:hypothetical protein
MAIVSIMELVLEITLSTSMSWGQEQRPRSRMLLAAARTTTRLSRLRQALKALVRTRLRVLCRQRRLPLRRLQVLLRLLLRHQHRRLRLPRRQRLLRLQRLRQPQRQY